MEIRKVLGILVLGLIISNASYGSSLTEQLNELNELYKKGAITKEEFAKAKVLLLNKNLPAKKKTENLPSLEKLKKLYENGTLTKPQYLKAKAILKKKIDLQKSENIKIGKFKDKSKNTGEFEKMEMIIGDFRFYTHRPGAIKVRRISDKRQLLVIADNLKKNYYNDGEDFFTIETDKENLKMYVKINNVKVLHLEGRYIKKYQAYFYQVLATGSKPFHYYVVLKNGKTAALNIDKFTKRIDKAVAKAKKELAQKHGITLEQIELIIQRRDLKVAREVENIILSREDEIIKRESEKALDEGLRKAVGDTIADHFAEFFGVAHDELAMAIDQVIGEAVNEGISGAAIAAGIATALSVLASGGSEQEAWDKGCAAAGLESGC